MKYMPFGARSPVAACDYSGTIVKSNVSHFQPGDEVYGLIHMPFKIWRGMGSLAEYVVAPADTCAKRPPHVPQADAAGLTLVGVTALAMSGEIDFKKHEKPRVLVCGGSSAVGLMLIPILRQKGCSVTATCSEPKADVVKKRGADAVINYRSSNFQQHLKDEAANNGLFDYILDCVDSFDVWNVSPHILVSAVRILNSGAKRQMLIAVFALFQRGTSYISVGFDASQGLLPAVRRIMSYLLLPGWLGGVSTRYRRPSDPATQERMSELAKLVDEGECLLLYRIHKVTWDLIGSHPHRCSHPRH